MKIVIIASDIHTGGGKVVLNDFLNAAKQMLSINFYVLVDERFNLEGFNSNNISFEKISKTQRIFYVNKVVSEIVNIEDVIINISGLPYFKRYPCSKVQFIMNRYFIENYPTVGLPLLVRLRLAFQKVAFSYFLKYTDYIFVQNSVMRDLLLKLGFKNDIIEVIPYKNIDKVIFQDQKIKESFLYVASEEVHKNHLNLVKAWIRMSEENIYPTLYLTIDDKTELYKKILIDIQKFNLRINVLSNIPREELLKYYDKVSALIYPSYFECFGIPLIEAKNHNLPVIASELDYVRDFVNPVESFDPHSPKSISRAVRRFLGQDEKKITVLSPKDFAKEIVLYANK